MNTIKIGSQVWATQDLKVTKFRNGENIPLVEDDKEWGELTTAAYCVSPDGNYLYNWYAVNDPRGLAPEGFHVPSDEEWTELTDGLGGEKVAGKQLKSDSCGGTNSSGFSGLPGGHRDFDNGAFYNLGLNGYWWSSSPSASGAWFRGLDSGNSNVFRDYYSVRSGFSVRCIKNTNQMKPELMSASFTFGQEGNTEGTTSEYEEITIDYENPLGNHHGFFVLRTQGWSIDNLEELGELLERIKKIDTERGMRTMSEQELILRAEISDKEEADEAMAILRKDYDPTYVWCADCDYIVVKERDCCNNKNKEK